MGRPGEGGDRESTSEKLQEPRGVHLEAHNLFVADTRLKSDGTHREENTPSKYDTGIFFDLLDPVA